MNIGAGGLPGALGALPIDRSRSVSTPQRPPSATAAPAVQKPNGGFEQGVFQARAVTAPEKAQSAQTAPNPNLPRGSLIDLKV